MENLRKQISYQQHNVSLDRSRMLTLSPSKSPQPTNRFSMKGLLHAESGILQDTLGGRITRHKVQSCQMKNISQTLLNKLRQHRVKRSPSVEELSKMFPAFKIEMVQTRLFRSNIKSPQITSLEAY